LVKLAGGSPKDLATIRAIQDFMYDAYQLNRAHLLDDELCLTLKYQIKSNWQSKPVSDVWKVVSKSGAFCADFVEMVVKITKIPDAPQSGDVRSGSSQ
jgi:hypothetical protein